MEMNLYEYLQRNQNKISESRVRHIFYQLLLALNHMHQNQIFHRDIKPENILITENQVKLADFGSCRGLNQPPPYTEYISTRWYRAPECLLTDGYYQDKMDMWGLGCVIYEMLTNQPLFPGNNELDQINIINQIIGTPQKELLQKFSRLASHMEINFPPNKPGQGIPNLTKFSPDLRDLIQRLLIYDPSNRISALECLQHPFFKNYREIDYQNQLINPNKLFSFRQNGNQRQHTSESDYDNIPQQQKQKSNKQFNKNQYYYQKNTNHTNSDKINQNNLSFTQTKQSTQNKKLLNKNHKHKSQHVNSNINSTTNTNIANMNQRSQNTIETLQQLQQSQQQIQQSQKLLQKILKSNHNSSQQQQEKLYKSKKNEEFSLLLHNNSTKNHNNNINIQNTSQQSTTNNNLNNNLNNINNTNNQNEPMFPDLKQHINNNQNNIQQNYTNYASNQNNEPKSLDRQKKGSFIIHQKQNSVFQPHQQNQSIQLMTETSTKDDFLDDLTNFNENIYLNTNNNNLPQLKSNKFQHNQNSNLSSYTNNQTQLKIYPQTIKKGKIPVILSQDVNFLVQNSKDINNNLTNKNYQQYQQQQQISQLQQHQQLSQQQQQQILQQQQINLNSSYPKKQLNNQKSKKSKQYVSPYSQKVMINNKM
ncbi:Protein kinase-like domain [Pseudocohnilembus persalinus]|uniref:Cyclin-dependent kinase 2 homolog n=1 Tax=Pseudocohnilembus persalinus TaxID=266149 RepID=A0A0V0QHP4_PSEPJ|nr:Protein kinase-like domain [Pseudocohnilembus persalinus]|eukprot:KRX01640.1 Protein kinase-like domain [Pseudocohnilembus persalinus]